MYLVYVESFSDALRMEVSSFGIDVILIEPSGVKTNWWKIATERLKQTSKSGVYESQAKKTANGMLKLGNSKMMVAPEKIARYVVGFGGKTLIFLHCILPTRCYDWIAKKVI